MAGTLLLIPKDSMPDDRFMEKVKRLESFINKSYRQHFNSISFHHTNSGALLVEFRKNENSRYFTDDNGNWLTYEGTVFALNETKALSAQSLLNLYLNTPDSFPNHLDGHFVIKIYDARQNKHLIITDILKNKINYISENNQSILITPFLVLTGLLNKPEPDLYAINEFMWRYYILSDRSVFKNVRKLNGASVYEINQSKINRKVYWNWPETYLNIPFHSAVDQMTESMKESARLIHHTFGPPCIDFTMGQDTRQVISAFTNQRLSMTTSIFGKNDFYEVQKIREMSGRHKIINHNIQLENDYLKNSWFHFERSLLLGSGEQPAHLLSRILYMREKQKQWGNVVLNGQDGHFYKNGLWDEMYTINLYREPKEFNIKLFLKFRALSKNYRDNIFNSEFLKIKNNSGLYFSELIKTAIKDYMQSPVSIQADRFDIYSWLNFIHAANNTMNIVSNSISPLLLRRNLELAIQLPVQWKFNLSRFQRALVFQLDPSLAAEKTDFGGVNMIPKNMITTIPFHLRYYYFQSERLRNKVKTKLGMKVTTHLQEAWDYQPVYQNFYTTPEVQELLDYTKMNLAGIINKSQWNHTYQDKTNQTINNLDYILKLAGIEYLLKSASQLS